MQKRTFVAVCVVVAVVVFAGLSVTNAQAAKGNLRTAAKVFILVDKSEQKLTLYINGQKDTHWYVSTGAGERVCPPHGSCYVSHTPTGVFKPTRMHREYRSRSWGVQMDYAIFLYKGIALHATYAVNGLGQEISGGCIRQEEHMAKYLFDIVERYGKHNTVVKIQQ